MSILTIILLAIGLAMDCFAVSVCKGLTSPHGYVPRYVKPMLMALLFGVFHAGMPLIGYFAGSLFASFFERFAPWIALLLLGFIGGMKTCMPLSMKSTREQAIESWMFPLTQDRE